MPNTGLYKIEIELKGSVTSSKESPIAGQEPQSTSATANATNTSGGEGVSKGKLSALVAYRQIKPFVAQALSNEVGKVGLKTGSNRLQEKANFTHEVATKVWNFGESVAMGAYFGGLPGAIVGAVVSTAHTLITYSNNQNVININRSIENQSIQMNYIRAGAQGSRSK